MDAVNPINPSLELIKDLGSTSLLMVFGYWLIKYLFKKVEDLQLKQENLITTIQADHKESRDKIVELHKFTIEKHEECNEKYADLSIKYNEVVNNNTRVVEKLIESHNRR